jgi:hypothetical protein
MQRMNESNMDIPIDKTWVEVKIGEFEDLISNINWHRDAMSTYDRYYRRGSNKAFGATNAAKTKAWVDPKFFKARE